MHFKNLIKDLKKAFQPVIFLSGDSHHSEINLIEKDILGYETYEITSSPVHSFIYRNNKETLIRENPGQLIKIKEHNYIVIDSRVSKKSVNFEVFSMGVKQKKPFFKKTLKVAM